MQGLPFVMPAIPLPHIPSTNYDIRQFGAEPGGLVKNTKAIANAIASASANGGGRVIVPKGRWLTGPIHLKNRVALQVDAEAELLFSQEIADYLPPVFTRWEGTECMGLSPLIYCRGCEDIAITGKGTLNGQGNSWWRFSKNQRVIAAQLYEMAVQKVPVGSRVFSSPDNLLRPSFVQFVESRRILIEGITIQNGPMWTIHPVYSENIVVRRVTVMTEGPNGDGCDVDSSRNVLIEDSNFHTRDDCIVIKSGLNEDGWRVGRPSENIVIRHVTFTKGHGGVVIGSEMSGGVRRVFAEKCIMNGINRGLRIKSREGRGGFVEDIWYQDMKHRALLDEGIQITTFYGASTVEPRTRTVPRVNRIYVRDVHGQAMKQAFVILGLPSQPIRDVIFERVSLTGRIGAMITDVENLKLWDVEVRNQTGPNFQIAQSRWVDLKNITCGGSSPCVSITGAVSDGISVENLTCDEGSEEVRMDKDVSQNSVRYH
jgi:polygalacturonase